MSPLPTIKANVRIIGEERTRLSKRLVQQYKRGASIRTLAAETGRSYGFIQRILSESNVTLRPRGGNTRRSTHHASDPRD